MKTLRKVLKWYCAINTIGWAYVGIGYYLKKWDDYPTADGMLMSCCEEANSGWKLMLNKTKVLFTLLKR